jgi:hypothetical protein
MSAQLKAFDQRLAVFERRPAVFQPILDALVEWGSTWARWEEAVGDVVGRDRLDGTPSDS